MGASAAALADLMARPYAHRGLHGPGAPENSLAAARAAMAGGFGMECDVRLSRDGIPHLFHDADLSRLTDGRSRFHALDAATIATLRLAGGDEPPPRLSALLALAGRALPLLIELKSDRGPRACARLCAAVARDLEGHVAPVAVMSFDPLVVRWFARHLPHVLRGLVVSRRHRWRLSALFVRARPHFIARDVRDLPAGARPALPLLCWTVRTPAERDRAARAGAQIIFEEQGLT